MRIASVLISNSLSVTSFYFTIIFPQKTAFIFLQAHMMFFCFYIKNIPNFALQHLTFILLKMLIFLFRCLKLFNLKK